MQQVQALCAQRRERIAVQGIALSVTREGKGAPVLCLHAVGHNGADFDSFAQRFRTEYEIIRVDWPGHGLSGADSVSASAQRYAALLGELVPLLAIEPPILLGNSIGGAAAILFAARHPVRALVLCDSGGLVAVDWVVRLFCSAFAAIFAQGARGARWYRWLFSLYYRRLVLPAPAASAQRERIIAAGYAMAPLLRDAWRSFGRPEADLRETLLELCCSRAEPRASTLGSRAELRASTLGSRAEPRASTPVPVWFAWARRDRVIPFERVRAFLARVPNARVSLFEAGHTVFLECPVEFAEGFSRFVRESRRP